MSLKGRELPDDELAQCGPEAGIQCRRLGLPKADTHKVLCCPPRVVCCDLAGKGAGVRSGVTSTHSWDRRRLSMELHNGAPAVDYEYRGPHPRSRGVPGR